MILLTCLTALAQNFSDLNSSYWAYNAIQSLASQNIITGYSDGTFRPDNPVTRAEFATMIINNLNQGNAYISDKTTYTDVPRGFWAYNNIQKANNLGLIRGFPDGTFRPNAYISKAEVLTILANAARIVQLSKQEAEQILDRFYDVSSIPDWAVVPVARAVNAGLVVNYPQPNFLMPEKKATRADVAAMLYNLSQYLGKTQPTIP